MSYYEEIKTIVEAPEFKLTSWWDETLVSPNVLKMIKLLGLTDDHHDGFNNLIVPSHVALLVGIALDKGYSPDITKPFTYVSYYGRHNYKFGFDTLDGIHVILEE